MTTNSKLTKRQIAMGAVLGGASHKEAAALVGVARQTVSNWCCEEEICTRPRATDGDKRRALALVDSGHSHTHAAKVVGYNQSTVSKWVKRRELESP